MRDRAQQTQQAPRLAVCAASGLAMIVRTVSLEPYSPSAPDLSRIMLAGTPGALALAAKRELGPLRGGRKGSDTTITTEELVELYERAHLLPTSMEAVGFQSALTQGPVQRRRFTSCATDKLTCGEADELWCVEPLLEWELVSNLLVLAVAISLSETLSAAPGAHVLDPEGPLIALPLAHDPSERLRVTTGVLDEAQRLPLLHRVESALGGLCVRSRVRGRALVEVICTDDERGRENVMSAIDSALGRGSIVICDGLPRIEAKSATERIWTTITSSRNVRACRCAVCGRYFVTSRAGSQPCTCSMACKDRRRRQPTGSSACAPS